jgi:hypothetical protein
MKKLIFLADIDFDASPVVRAQVHTDAIADYAEAYKSKAQMPLPVLFQANGDKHLLVGDGRHRLEALRSIGKKAMECDVKSGSAEDAFRYALSANGNHGIRRTNADKRLCVELASRCWPELSTKEMATICAVSEGFVNSIRRQDMPEKGENEPAKEPASDSGSNASASQNKKPSSSKHGTSNQGEAEEAESQEPEPPPIPVDAMGFPLPEVSARSSITRTTRIKCFATFTTRSHNNWRRFTCRWQIVNLMPSARTAMALSSTLMSMGITIARRVITLG